MRGFERVPRLDQQQKEMKMKTETTETKQPKRIGRPPLGKRAMTNAERQQRYRDLKRAQVAELLRLTGNT